MSREAAADTGAQFTTTLPSNGDQPPGPQEPLADSPGPTTVYTFEAHCVFEVDGPDGPWEAWMELERITVPARTPRRPVFLGACDKHRALIADMARQGRCSDVRLLTVDGIMSEALEVEQRPVLIVGGVTIGGHS